MALHSGIEDERMSLGRPSIYSRLCASHNKSLSLVPTSRPNARVDVEQQKQGVLKTRPSNKRVTVKSVYNKDRNVYSYSLLQLLQVI